MTESMPRIGRSLAVVLLIGALIRIVVAVAAGMIEWAQNDHLGYPTGAAWAGDILITLGDGGDGVGVLLALAAGALVAWLLVSREPAGWLRSATGWVFGLTALSAFAQTSGHTLLFSIAPESVLWSRVLLGAGHSLVYAGVALGGLAATRRLDALTVVHAAERFGDDDPFVFAVDRRSGDVAAYFSVDAAERKTHVYYIEDDELDFYTDEGKAIGASVEHGRVSLQPTDVDQREVLLERLREFVVRRGIHLDSLSADDPSAYAAPISDWQWLQLWPGWLRWLGRFFRPR